MFGYRAVFLKIEGLSEKVLEPHHDLNASTREQAEAEAFNLPKPEEANFIRLYRDGQFEAPQIGIDL